MNSIRKEKIERLKDMQLAFGLLAFVIIGIYYLFIEDPDRNWEALALSGIGPYLLVRFLCATKEKKINFRIWTYEKSKEPTIYYLLLMMNGLFLAACIFIVYGYIFK